MQHIRKCDAPELLPFARNCIRRLQATGLEYGSQKFDVAGITVRVEIRPGAEYIWIEGGSYELSMDSGLVELHMSEPYPAGTLYESQSAFVYNQSFIATEPPSDWRKRPGTTSSGQVAGTVRYNNGRLTGKVPYDIRDASCFSPGKEKLGDGPPTPIVRDGILVQKEIAATLCPASIFTGRCRLWVQAMYGNPTYSESSTGIGKPARVPSIGPGYGDNIAPSLLIPAYLPTDGKDDISPIHVTTSCGVLFDADTGTHWLIVPNTATTLDGDIVAYPLTGSPSAERMRRFIKSSATLLTTIEDKDNLETHVLASCLPDPRRMVVIGNMRTPGGWYMGYGWHWNWRGDSAVIVANKRFVQSGSGSTERQGMRSEQHFIGVTVSHDTDGNPHFAAATAFAETADWAVDRAFWVICEANWATRLPEKTTAALTTPIDSDAPFYAFYVRDTLKVCRIKTQLIEQPAGTRTITAGYGDTAFGGTVTEATFGAQSGSYRDISHGTARWTATISCGGWEKANLQMSWGEGGPASAVFGKSRTGVYGAGYGGVTAINVNMEYGETVPYETVHVNYGSTNTGKLECITFMDSQTTISRTGWSTVEVVVPVDDAEAIYIRTQEYTREEEYGTKRMRQTYPAASAGIIAASGWIEGRQVAEIDKTTGLPISDTLYIKADWAVSPVPLPGWNLLSTDTGYVADPIVTDVSESWLFSHAGQTTVDFGSLDQFHNNTFEDIVADFATRSGTRTDSPVVIATARSGTVGTHGAPTTAAVIVGQL